MFAIWFASGVVMIYVPFPSLPDAERIARAEIVDISGITSLSDALTATDIQSVDRLRLLQYQERPTVLDNCTRSWRDSEVRTSPKASRPNLNSNVVFWNQSRNGDAGVSR